MPVFCCGGFRFFFHSNEGDPPEPAYVHAFTNGAEAKLRLRPVVTTAYDTGHDACTLATLGRIVEEHRTAIESALA